MSRTQQHRPDPEDTGGPEGQVSEVSSMDDPPTEVAPGDAVAGAPDQESGKVQEGATGPEAPPRHHGRPRGTGHGSDEGDR